MAIGVFYGDSKPDNIEEYLTPFVEEMGQITKNGVMMKGHVISVRIRCFICDSPARAFIKGTLILHIYLNYFSIIAKF